jgi:hypothetical protein
MVWSVSEPEQEQPVEQQQQHRLPRRLGPSSIAMLDGEAMDPAAILSSDTLDEPGK